MYSIFTHSPSRMNIEKENNVAARKPALSTRKPLGDRKLGENLAQKPLIQQKKAQKIKNDSIDFDICSYKDVPDNYNDLIDPQINKISSILFGKMEKTPPPKRHDFKLEFIDNNFDSVFFDDFDSKQFEIADFENVPLPEIHF